MTDIATSALPRQCLQCFAPEGINVGSCEVWGGVEYYELLEEWENHQFDDWADDQLAAHGIKPEAFDRHRRDLHRDLDYADCDDYTFGHRWTTAEDVAEQMADRVGECVHCGARRDGAAS